MTVFNKHLLALDWDFDLSRLYSFESWRERDFSLNLIAALPNNHKIVLYSKSQRKLYLLTRDYS